MSSEKSTCAPKASSVSAPVPTGDHRKRRRNRTTQSCLNCHGSKRMCDRRRPACQRCTTLGLTGLCVYEVDDPSQRSNFMDEKALLRSRVAELEGVIREMKNKPHPRWTQKPETRQTSSALSSDDDSIYPLESTSGEMTKESNSNAAPVQPLSAAPEPVVLAIPNIRLSPDTLSPDVTSSCESALTPQDPYFLGTFNFPSSPTSSSPDSPAFVHEGLSSITSEDLSTMIGSEFSGLLANSLEPINYQDGIFGHILEHIMQTDQVRAFGLLGCDLDARGPNSRTCGCIDNVMAYNSLLELSIRLRKAVESLGRVADHRLGNFDSGCQLYSKICELDKLTSITLSNAMSPEDKLSPLDAYFTPLSSGLGSSTISSHCLPQWASNGVTSAAAESVVDDSFMTWDGMRPEHASIV
ncbi:hypothetical protein DFH11DRAFT_1780234 [Phellopilus nigrolimitatus]|nr:hypothetical protein DFH11DRAFT_1780234 [Phellopilus nigrolimitatus]